MSWFAAITTGFGLGLAYFGALWLTVRRVVLCPGRRSLIGVSGLARLVLLVLALIALSREGPAQLLAGLAGLWLARWYLLWELGGRWHGR